MIGVYWEQKGVDEGRVKPMFFPDLGTNTYNPIYSLLYRILYKLLAIVSLTTLTHPPDHLDR